MVKNTTSGFTSAQGLVMRSRRKTRFVAHLICDVTALVIFASPTALLMIMLGAPTWAWVIITIAVWTWAAYKIWHYVENDPDLRRYL